MTAKPCSFPRSYAVTRPLIGTIEDRAGIPSVEVAAHMGHGLDVLHRTYAHVIEDLQGEPPRPVAEVIASARGDVVRPAFGQSAG